MNVAIVGEQMEVIGKKWSLGITAPLMIMGGLAVKNADQQAKAVATLKAAISSVGNEANVSVSDLTSFASAMQKVTLYGDEATLAAMGILEAMTQLDTKGLTEIMPHVMDFATAVEMDLQSAAELVGKAVGTSTNALARYGVELEEGMTPAEKLASITETLQGRFSGFAEAAAKAGAGPLQVFQNRMSDISEQFGAIIIPRLASLLDKIEGILKWLEGLNPKAQEFLVTFGAIAAVTGPGLVFLGQLAQFAPTMVSAVGGLSNAFNGLATSMGSLAGAGALEKLMGLAGLIGAPFVAAVAAFAALAPKAAELAKNIAYWLEDVAVPAVGRFAQNVGRFFADLATSIADFISRMAAAVWDWVTNGLNRALDRVKSWVNDVKGAFGWLWDKLLGHSIIPDIVRGAIDWFNRMCDTVEDRVGSMTRSVNDSFNSVSTDRSFYSGAGVGMGGSGIQDFSQELAGAIEGLSGFAGTLIAASISGGSMGVLFELLKPVLSGIFDIIGPAMNDVLVPLIGSLVILGQTIGQQLKPTIDALMPVFELLAKVLLLLARPIGLVAEVIGWTLKWITYGVDRFLAWIDGLLGTQLSSGVAKPESFRDMWSRAWKAFTAEIDWDAVTVSGKDYIGETGGMGGGAGVNGQGATYTQARQIVVESGASLITVNTDVIVGESGGFQELAVLMAREIRRVEALGLV